MNVSVVDLSENQKKLQVEIPPEKVRQEIEGKYREMSRRIKIKGFRPGKVPRSIIKSYYGKTIEQEVSSQFIQETFPEALKETDLKPLVEADVSETHFNDSGSFSYTAIVDVCPPFELEGYRGLEIRKPSVDVADEQVDSELQRLREQHAELRTLETERPAREGDVAVIDFTPSVDGKVFERGKSADYMAEIGKKAVHPDFDVNLIGRRAGETVSFEVDYPENAPMREIAGKRVLFEVTVKEVKEKVLPELDDEFAQAVNSRFDALDALKQTIREELLKREEYQARSDVQQQILDQLLSKVKIELSAKVIDREVDRMVGNLLHQFESQGLKMDVSKFNTPEIRADYRPQAERNILRRLILEKIAEQENLKLADEEIEQVYQEVARYARMDVATVKHEYADSAVVEQSKESKIQEKVFRFLESEAVSGHISQEEKSE
ncbi:MAG TPA: trigger factor [Syntrophobacter fumaroxidans]|nr:trigger factor [Syntrophobacter fumaroxidans]